MNAKFDSGVLEHGKRYMICIHADKDLLKHELWEEELPAVSSCSDGVVVDLTKPTAGNVWIGLEKGTLFQVGHNIKTVLIYATPLKIFMILVRPCL